jgi:hypothetical protein
MNSIHVRKQETHTDIYQNVQEHKFKNKYKFNITIIQNHVANNTHQGKFQNSNLGLYEARTPICSIKYI